MEMDFSVKPNGVALSKLRMELSCRGIPTARVDETTQSVVFRGTSDIADSVRKMMCVASVIEVAQSSSAPSSEQKFDNSNGGYIGLRRATS